MTKTKTSPKDVRIGAVSASFVDSRIAMPQLLNSGIALDYLVFDCLAEGVMSILARQRIAGNPAWVTDFVDAQMSPYLAQISERGIKIIANAGGLDPQGCAGALRQVAAKLGLPLKIASICGDDLSSRAGELVPPGTPDMFDGNDLGSTLASADQFLSLVAYTGAFPIAAALAEGADIVVTGRAVDSAATLGPLIHEFGWGKSDFDLLSAGTLAGHLIECTTQICGATFTDWRDVPDWANIGFPVATCHPDGSVNISKPAGTGGLINRGTVSEQLLYEVGDPAAYIVPDVICDWTGVQIEETGPDQARVFGARGTGAPSRLKAALTWDKGWRASVLTPVIGHESAAKAERTASELFRRCDKLAADRDLPAYALKHVEIIGGNDSGAGTAICRMVADHPAMAGAALFAREQSSTITSMAVGTSAPLGTTVRPLTHFASFLLPRDDVTLSIAIDDREIAYSMATAAAECPQKITQEPGSPAGDAVTTVPLVALAWVRSGDKGNLFNVGVIAREPEYYPWLYHALKPEQVAHHYAPLIQSSCADTHVVRYPVPGINALNLVVNNAMGGGMLAHPGIDNAAKGMGQRLLDFPIPVSAAIQAKLLEEQCP